MLLKLNNIIQSTIELKDLFILALFKLLPFISNFLIAGYLIDIAGEGVFAKYTVVIASVLFIITPLTYAISQLIFKEVALKKNHGVYQNRSYVSILVVFLFMCFYILINYRDALESGVEILSILLISSVMMMASVVSGVFRGFGNIILSQTFDLMAKPIMLIVLVAIYIGNQSINTANDLLLIHFFAYFFAFVFMYLFYRKIKKQKSFKLPSSQSKTCSSDLKKTLGMLFVIAAPAFGNLWYSEGVIVMMYVFGDAIDVLELRLSLILTAIIAAPLTIVNVAFSHKLAKTLNKTDRFLVIFNKSRIISVALSLLLFLVIVLLQSQIANYYSNASYRFELGAVFYIFSISYLFSAFVGPVGQLMVLTGQHSQALKLSLLSLLVSIGVFFPLTSVFGAVGASVSVLLGNFLVNYLFFKEIKKYISM